MFILILNEFTFKNLYNPTWIDEINLGVAYKKANFKVGFSDKICFFSSNSFLLFSLFGGSNSPNLDLIFTLIFWNQNKSLYRSKNARYYMPKRNRFTWILLFTFKSIQVLSEIGRIESWKYVNKKYLFLRWHINQFNI